jgi:PAS domain S-box-containing protein
LSKSSDPSRAIPEPDSDAANGASRLEVGLFDRLNVAVIATDPEGLVTHWNRHAEALYGWSKSEALGRNIRELVLDMAEAGAAEAIMSQLLAGESWEGQFTVGHKDGTRLPVYVSDAALRDASGRLIGFVGVSVDLSERLRAERLLGTFSGVTLVLAGAESLAEATPEILGTICERLGWDVGAIWKVDAEAGVLRSVDVWHGPAFDAPRFEELTRETVLGPGEGLPGRVWATGRPAWIAEITEDPNFPRGAAAAQDGLHAGFAFPIVSASGVVGVLEFFTRIAHQPDEELLSMMGGIGSLIGQFVDRREAARAVVESEARKSAILESSLDAIVSMDHRGRIVEFNPAAEKIFGYSRDEVLDREMVELIIPPRLRARHRQGLARYLATGEPSILGRRLELAGMRSDGSEFPVELTVTRVHLPGPPLFTGYLRDITDGVITDHERRRAKQGLAMLAEASEVLGASLDYEETLAAIARLSTSYLADWCTIKLLEEDRSIRRVAAAHADPEKEELLAEVGRYPIDVEANYVAARVLRTGEAVVLADTEKTPLDEGVSPEHRAALRALETRSAMILPLTARGRTLGVVTFARSGSSGRYDVADLALADDLARRAAQALENARLYQERDYIARTLQQSLLPPKVPSIPGLEVGARYLPAGQGNEVGGDFYDVFQTSGRAWMLVIGDVCGKGAEAAALTGLARHTIRADAMRETRPSRILRTLNEALLHQAPSQGFCTVCCVRLRRSITGVRLTVCAGGHPLPVALRADGSLETVGAPGTLLGVFPDAELLDRSVDLSPGDAVILYTDGVTEERSSGVVFGEVRFSSLLRSCAGLDAAAIAERVEKGVVDFQPEPPRDDLAILVVRVPPDGQREGGVEGDEGRGERS